LAAFVNILNEVEVDDVATSLKNRLFKSVAVQIKVRVERLDAFDKGNQFWACSSASGKVGGKVDSSLNQAAAIPVDADVKVAVHCTLSNRYFWYKLANREDQLGISAVGSTV